MYINAKPQGSKVSRLETLRQVEKSTGIKPTELIDCPQLDDNHHFAWSAFTSLVEYNYQELESYSRMTGIELDCWEVEAIMALAKFREVEPTWPLK